MDRVVRVLATSCDRANRAVPAVHAVVVGPDTVWFHLSTPDERPPAGWTADHDGRTWHAQLRWLQSASVTESLAEPYPQLVPLGSTSKGFVLLNLSRAGGIISVEGDARQAQGLAQDWTRQLTTSPWSQGVRVVRTGFKPGTENPTGVTETNTPADLEAALAANGGGVLLLAGLPGGRHREHIHNLAEDPAGTWSVVVIGRVERPRWRLTIDATGLVNTRLLDEPVAHLPTSAPGVTAPAFTDTDAGSVANPSSTAAPAGGRFAPLLTPRWIIAAVVTVACLAGAAVFLAPGNTSSSQAAAAKAAGTTAAASSAAAQPGSASASSAPNLPDPHLVNSLTSTCLSASAGSDGTALILDICSDDENQSWAIDSDGTIRAMGLCMDAAGGGTTAGTVVQIANCSGNPAQQFSIRNGAIYSAQADLCVDETSDGMELLLFTCSDSKSQLFTRG